MPGILAILNRIKDEYFPCTVEQLNRCRLVVGYLGTFESVARKPLLERVWMPATLLDRPVEKLSGGELQRVLLALALQPTPEMLFLDEPAAGIDFQTQEEFYDLIGDRKSVV